MSLWQRLRSRLGAEAPSLPPAGNPLTAPGPDSSRGFALDAQLLAALEELAERERREPHEIMSRLVDRALSERRRLDAAWACWRMLTPREQDVVALICLGYTTPQIALHLSIGTQTVRTYARNALEKFELPTRRELREQLANWDFGAWDPRKENGAR